MPFAANAYIDPGVGGFLTQIILGLFAGLVYIVRVFWVSIKLFFGRLFLRQSKDSQPEHQDGNENITKRDR